MISDQISVGDYVVDNVFHKSRGRGIVTRVIPGFDNKDHGFVYVKFDDGYEGHYAHVGVESILSRVECDTFMSLKETLGMVEVT